MKTKMLLGSLSVFLLSIILVACGPDDGKIRKEVSGKLADSSLPVTAVIQKGVITLSGVVETDAQKEQAESIAKAVDGVKSVTNNITVTPPAPTITPDQALTALAKKGLDAAGFSTVNVSIADSVVTVSGDVKKADFKKVLQIVNDLKPRKVINELKATK